LIPLILSLLLAGPLKPVDDGGYRSLVSSHHGRVLLVDFWATWCEPCRAELPKLAELQLAMKRKGLRLVTISCDEPEQRSEALRLLRENKISEPFFIKEANDNSHFINSVDSEWSGALPALFLYDRNGRMVRSFGGEVEISEVEAAVRKLL
jgi:thiol-disulfide isomerase/thioredoxin